MMIREFHGESNVWSTAERFTDLIFMLSFSESIDQLAIVYSVR